MISRPLEAVNASRRMAWCASSSSLQAAVPSRSASLVEPSMSVNRKVTVPVGRASTGCIDQGVLRGFTAGMVSVGRAAVNQDRC